MSLDDRPCSFCSRLRESVCGFRSRFRVRATRVGLRLGDHDRFARRTDFPKSCQPSLRRKFSFSEPQMTCIAGPVPRLSGGRIAIVTRRGAGCDGRFGLRETSAAQRGRRSRVVVVPRRWDQASRAKPREVTEAIKPGTPAKHEISRNTVAQGMPDRLAYLW